MSWLVGDVAFKLKAYGDGLTALMSYTVSVTAANKLTDLLKNRISKHPFKYVGAPAPVNLSNRSSHLSFQQLSWDALVLLVVTFWLSSSVLLDFFMMPIMYESGMMNAPGFATSSYSLFWVFNRLEVLCAAAILTGLLVIRHQQRSQFEVIASGARSRWALMVAGALLAIALLYTYVFTPHMSALGLSLDSHFDGNFSQSMPQAMGLLHLAYWGLEALKLFGAAFLLKLCYRDIAIAFR